MKLAQWTPRRVAALWAVGIALQLVVIIAPALYVAHVVRRDVTRLVQQDTAREARLKGSEQADSVSRIQQLASARAAGQFRLGADGDTVFAVVGMPSGRPDPQRMAALRRSMRRTVDVVLGIEFGTIPLALVGLTIAWFLARRRSEGLARAPRVV